MALPFLLPGSIHSWETEHLAMMPAGRDEGRVDGTRRRPRDGWDLSPPLNTLPRERAAERVLRGPSVWKKPKVSSRGGR